MTFCESKWPNDLKGQGQCLTFSVPAARIQRCIFGANLVNLAQIHWKLLRGQAEIPRILSQNGLTDLEGHRSMTAIFNTSWEYPRMHVWCKFGDSSPNLWWVITRTNQISLSSESKWPKWPWRSQSMTCFFQYQLRVSQDACLVQIWWF